MTPENAAPTEDARSQIFDITRGALPVLTVVALMGGVSGFALWLNSNFTAVNFRLDTIDRTLATLGEGHVDEDDLRLWIERARVLNPDVAFPDF